MIERQDAAINQLSGLEGDHAGKYPDRLVTILSAEAWADALAALPETPSLHWTVRRANLLVSGVALPRAKGGVVQIGEVRREVTGQTWPCKRMEEVQPGLLKALAKDWRDGLTCKVIDEGRISIGDSVDVLVSPSETIRRLP